MSPSNNNNNNNLRDRTEKGQGVVNRIGQERRESSGLDTCSNPTVGKWAPPKQRNGMQFAADGRALRNFISI
ncbi:hypothetical protein TorRG33x02_247540 [Trema orientale]|uniref:Uncharacterized protein n=1 Tax=Trema orientale TaxID=63057 RepID=A0A2P5DLN2_TREOI|nr:hypothetical protein TorRG33x02_247540 [Trema orientale]